IHAAAAGAAAGRDGPLADGLLPDFAAGHRRPAGAPGAGRPVGNGGPAAGGAARHAGVRPDADRGAGRWADPTGLRPAGEGEGRRREGFAADVLFALVVVSALGALAVRISRGRP